MVAVKKKKTEVKVKAEKKSKPTKSKVISKGLEKQMKKKAEKQREKRGIVLIKHLPHGFFEDQLKTYFSQFGKVTRLRLVRSQRTTKSRGYAFIEFQYPEVAQIAAETMNNYMMFKKVLKTAYIPPEKVKFNYFRSGILCQTKKNGEKVLTSRFLINRNKTINKYNEQLTEEQLQKRQINSQKKINKLKKKFAKNNIDYDIDAIVPDSLKAPIKTNNKALKEEGEQSDSDTDDSSLEPENFGFVADSDDDESKEEKNELDSEASEESDEEVATQKKKKSILKAKGASTQLLKQIKDEKKKVNKEKSDDAPVKTKKTKEKNVKGISKKEKKAPVKQTTTKMKKALKETIKNSDQVKVVKKNEMKKKGGKK